MTKNPLMALLFTLTGILSIAGGLFDWDWFILGRRARLIVRIFGRSGARIFYVVLGVAIVGLGLVAFVGSLVAQ